MTQETPVRRGRPGLRGALAGVQRLPARTPLRVTLVAALLALVAVALLATGAAATTALHGYLVSQVDKDLAHGPPPVGRFTPPDGEDGDDGRQVRPSRGEFYRVLATNGRVVVPDQSNDPSGPRPQLPGEVESEHYDRPFTVASIGVGPHWRVVVSPGVTRNGTPVVVYHAISLGAVDATVHRLVRIELLVGLVVLLLLGLVGYVVVRSSLRPLVEVERTAEAIADGDLTRRVPDRDPRTEVGRLSRSLNGMLAQIETAFRAREASEAAAKASEDRMRRFVADASHELRTPLTSIRGFAELYRQGAAPAPDDVARVMRRVEDEAARMGLLVDDLLLLARLDQQRPLERKPVDLLAIATDAVHDAGAVAPGRPVALQVLEDSVAPLVLGDEARLRQVTGNLVSNALTHTPPGTPVTVTVGSSDGQAVLAVTDAGPGLSEQEAARVFERFYRADPSRTRSGGGTGLGLSIVAALVAAHGGTVDVETEPGRGSTFRVRLPLHRPNGIGEGTPVAAREA
jgi:two-component system, OmpR family, sensor kinase